MIKKLVTTASSLTLIASMSAGMVFNTGIASATSSNGGRRYATQLEELNNSGVSGDAQLRFKGKELTVNLTASGLVPNMPHPAHIHGKLTGADAMCPTDEADVNNDGFVSVFEGAPAYGPIKLNLTSPQTAFGAPANLTLFAPFAGIPNIANFPVGSASGDIALDQTYTFDMTKPADKQAYKQLKALDKQHIVLHGAYAPENVDTPGGSSKIVYDALLPVACGEIHMSYGKNNSAQMHVNMHKMDSHSSSDSETEDDNSND